MMSEEKASCCELCFHNIAIEMPKAGLLWLDICDMCVHTDFVITNYRTFKELLFLENAGYLISTDREDYIIIKILNKQYDQDGLYFCRGDCGE